MARNPRNALLKQYLDAGIQFTQMTRERAESIVKDLVDAGEVRRKQANRLVDELVDRSRSNFDQMLETVRKEVQDQVAILEVVSKDAIARIEDQVNQLRTQIEGRGRTPAPAKRAASTAKKAASTARKAAPTRKAVAKKATAAKKTAARKASTAKRTAKKATARRTAKKA